MERGEAIALLKEIAVERALIPKWVSLINGNCGYEIHIKPDITEPASLDLIVKRHNLALREAKGLLVIYKEHGCP